MVSDFDCLKKAVRGEWPTPPAVKDLPIVVLNGNGRNGSARAAARCLRDKGMSWVTTGNASCFDQRHTVIKVPQTAYLDQGRKVARALGCGRVQAEATPTSQDRITVLLGGDYRP